MLTRIISLFFILLVNLYKYIISPVIPKSCRFLPTCSDYMITAIQVHGPLRGVLLGTKRLLRCQPFSSKSGIDNVPPK